VTIPCLIVLKMLDNEDKHICEYFLPQIYEKEGKINTVFTKLKEDFDAWKKHHAKSYHYYNIVEKLILSLELNEIEQLHMTDNEPVEKMVQKIK